MFDFNRYSLAALAGFVLWASIQYITLMQSAISHGRDFNEFFFSSLIGFVVFMMLVTKVQDMGSR